METIERYFTNLTPEQKRQLEALGPLYGEWNEKINVISRKDFDQLYVRHILHSLAIAKVCSFNKGARIIDVGTGGGFPGIPLAILFPEATFTLCDSIRKKITVVGEVAEAIGLKNVRVVNSRAEDVRGRFDYVVSRAVSRMKPFIEWVWAKIERGESGSLPNGVLYLKGGDLDLEMSEVGKEYREFEISAIFDEEFFETKKVVYLPKR